MSYKDKFNESQGKALSQIVATKIHKDLSDLRATIGNNSVNARRWIWELIQNAKDVHTSDGVLITIDIDLDSTQANVKFKHSGRPFTAENLRFLIEQISSKERTKDETGKNKTSGKFGTGFLTTHALSEIVTVKGVIKEENLDYVGFDVTLDRTGREITDIAEAVNQAKASLQNLDQRPIIKDYKEGKLNTEFYYPLLDDLSKTIASEGIADLDVCLPYSLIFVKELKALKLNRKKTFYLDDQQTRKLNDFLRIETVCVIEEDITTTQQFIVANNGFTQIVIPVNVMGDTVTILPINERVSRLYCDFPLVGAEKFSFPCVINNPNFNPTEPRDGVYLTTPQRADPAIEENKNIVQEAISLFYSLLKYASTNEWSNLHLLADLHNLPIGLKWVDEGWFKAQVLIPMRTELAHAEVVYNNLGQLKSILKDGSKFMWFPIASKKEIRHQIWKCAKYWFPHCLPREADIEIWNRVIWDECGKLNFNQFAVFVEFKKNVDDLGAELKNIKVFEWLNIFYDLLMEEEKEFESIIAKKAIVPNQNGIFCLKESLNREEVSSESENFKDILELLGVPIRSRLVDLKINLNFSKERTIDQQYLIREISSVVRERTNSRDIAKNYREGFSKLLSLFRNKPEESAEWFPDLYENKHILYNEEEIANNLAKAEELEDLFSEFNVGSTSELKDLLAQGKQEEQKMKVTREILHSLGITSLEEWHKALEDQNLKELFMHHSAPSQDMFLYAQSHIHRSKANVLAHLRTLKEYDLSDIDETAPTVIAGVIKEGRTISIVIRPAYQNEVIIYYNSERDYLDFDESELWVDNGQVVQRITLGYILKSGQIKKFPI